MSKRLLTLVLLSTLMLAAAPPARTIQASPSDGQKTDDAQAKASAERMLREAGESAVYDPAGRVSKLTLSISDKEKVGFTFIYDGQGRLQSLVQQDGVKMRLQYDAAGQWQSFVFDDGGRVTLERDREGKVMGTRTERPATRKPSQLKGARARTRKVALVDGCDDATDKAVEAVIAAGVACLPGPSIPCAAATALAAYRTYQAYQACKDKVAIEEGPVA
jgi:YD repeat-containing protein